MLVMKKKLPYSVLQNRALKQFGERQVRPQDEDKDLYRYVRRLNYGLLDSELSTISEQKIQTLVSFKPTSGMLCVNQMALTMYPYMNELTVVQTVTQFDEMMIELNCQHEISVDLEFHQRYSFRGTTALLQISSPHRDYIICPFTSRNDIITKLSTVLENPLISKVFHAIDNDHLCLRRDFGITVIGAVDTKEGYKLISGENNAIGLDTLIRDLGLYSDSKKMPNKDIAQAADWRIRPLPNELLSYARHDSHATLRVWNKLKTLLTEREIPIERAFEQTTALLLKLKYQPPKQEDPLMGLQSVDPNRRLDQTIRLKFVDLHRWRLQLGKMVDCSPKLILSNRHLLEIINLNPQSSDEMQSALNSRFPAFIHGHQGVQFYKVLTVGMRDESFDHTCHNCFLNSHQAWACWKSKDKSALKFFMNRPENSAFKDKQYQRRMKKLAENRARRAIK